MQETIMSRKFSGEIASPGSVSDTNESSTAADPILNKRMLPIVGTSMYSPTYRRAGHFGVFPPSARLAVDLGRLHGDGDVNDNFSSKQKRPAVTISSSQPQSFRKKKVGFDAEQCGFLRVNDIILTMSGNVSKTYEQLSANPERNAFIKELAFAKIRKQEKGVNWNQLRKLHSPKDKQNGYVSDALATYLQVIENPEHRRQPIDKQVYDLDTIIRDDSSNMSFISEVSSLNSPTPKSTPLAGHAGLWNELKKKGFKEVKHSKSLFEMLVPDDTQGECSDLKTRRKSALDPDSMFDDESFESTLDSVIAQSILSEASATEQRSETGKKLGQKKFVTIMEQDGTVHSPTAHRLAPINDVKEDIAIQLPVILISSPSVSFRNSSPQSNTSSIISSTKGNEPEQVPHTVHAMSRRSAIVSIPTDSKVIPPKTSSSHSLKDGSDSTVDNNNSSNLSSSRYARSRNRHKKEATMLHRAQGQSSSNAARQTGGNCVSLYSNNLEADVALVHWQLLQYRTDIESLRQENCRLKRTIMLPRTTTEPSNQKPHGLPAVFCDHGRGFIAICSCLTAIIMGMLLGKLII